ncbi:MAG: undecaprenyl-diphosphate phosphatase [Sphingobacterium sp.]
MELIKAIIVGIVQGLTEFLPVSSSGHIIIAQEILGLDYGEENNLLFAVVLHGATALSTLVVFRKEVYKIFQGLLEFKRNDALSFTYYVVISMLPAAIVGFFFIETLEQMFSNLLIVGGSLLVTSLLLLFAGRKPSEGKPINAIRALVIGIGQMFAAIFPGLSRSGTTISTALLMGVDRDRAAQFSFLMVLPLIIGATLKKILDTASVSDSAVIDQANSMTVPALIFGFLAAFLSGLFACQWMIKLIRNAKLYYFSVYCGLVGILIVAYVFWS